ncbi:MAG: polyribonucleotide nucleotidyltransferase [Bacteroidales bacterium]|jgi:polyribonucleotide nucleotidyltransferase
MNVQKTQFNIGDGRIVEIETGKLAKQADGSCVVKFGDTMLLATVVASKEAKEDVDFLPLSVEYREKYASAGRFPGGFFKRESRPGDQEILTARLVDRALRPLFPDDFHAEVQVIVTLISAEEDVLPDALACLAASSAIVASDIPFNGPVSEVRVARIDGKFVINPKYSELNNADIDIMVAATADNIMMVEGEMKEVDEQSMIDALMFAHENIKTACKAQLELAANVEKAKTKREYCHEDVDLELEKAIFDHCYQPIMDTAMKALSKSERNTAFEEIKNDFISTLSEEEAEEKAFLINRYYHKAEKEAVRNMVLDSGRRLDGRTSTEIRPIWTEVGYLPGAHGSAIFTRGETQSLSTVTLGSKLDIQDIDGAVIQEQQDFILHYNFPPFSTGEVRPIRSTSRREIGHGNLALRALKAMLPDKEDNPYTIRVVSDILESNGSSSMATVCAGSLALMDAGVKVKKPVAGIAMGLITDEKTGKYAVLSDILGDEDHLGDMDFKVTGTHEGITACQMDIKINGLPTEVLKIALEQARQGRIHILNEMAKTITEPREDYKPNVPRIETIKIDREFIGAVIGPGGKVIQEMQRETGATIVIEEEGEFGVIDIVSKNKEMMQLVKDKIKKIVAVPTVGEVYDGVVKNIQPFGTFVEILPGKDGLLHISEIDWKRIEKVEDVLKIGDQVTVKLIDIDPKTDKLKLSRKALIPRPEKK